MVDREILLKQIEAKEKEWEDQVKDLQSIASGFDAATRIKFEEQMSHLNNKLRVVETHLNEFKKHSHEVGGDLAESIAIAWTELVANIDNAFLKLKNKR